MILDPIQAYLGGGMDMNRANEARDMTKKLAALADKYQCAIVLVGHMNKAAKSPRQGAKALLIERSLSKVFLRYFRRK